MKNKKFKFLAVVVLTAMGSVFLFHTGLSDAAQCFIVNISKQIQGGESQIYLYPGELKVSKNSCVIWVNWVENENVNINFHANSKSCILASESPSGFMKVEGCFISDFLEYGRTVSLYFKESGVFGYRLEILEKSKGAGEGSHRKILREGKVIVE